MSEEYNAIGGTAGKIYNALEQKGVLSTSALQKQIKVADNALFHQALGWLARENKLSFKKDGKSLTVALVR